MPGHKRRHQEARGVTALAISLLVFAAAQLAFHTTEPWLGPFRDPYLYVRLAKLRTRSAAPDTITVVALGSSMTHGGFRASVAEEVLSRQLGRSVVVYNLAKGGGGPVFSAFVWDRLRQERILPQLLLVEVNPMLCGEDLPFDEFAPSVVPNSAIPGASLNFVRRYAPERAAEVAEAYWVNRLVPAVGLRQPLLNLVQPTLLPKAMRRNPLPVINDSGDGLYEDEKTPEQAHASMLRAVAHHRAFYRGAMPGRRPSEALAELVRSRRDGCQVALVYFPQSSHFRALCPAEKELALDRFLHEIADREGIPVIDARAWAGDDCFNDGVHLMRRGADPFSRRLACEVLLQLLRK